MMFGQGITELPNWETIALLAAIAGNLAQVLMARRKRETRRIEPQPLEVQLAHEVVRRDECNAKHAESLQSVMHVQKQIEDLRRKAEQDLKDAGYSRKALYTHIEDVRKELSDKIEQMPDRMVAMLRNFGIIGKDKT